MNFVMLVVDGRLRSWLKRWIGLLSGLGLLAGLVVSVWLVETRQELRSKASLIEVRVGDLLADVVIGQRDFTELAPREIVPYKLNSPGGVIVDRSVSPGRMYVWDSGNSRILGVDLGRCYAQDPPCTADIVIGQPSASDWGACNRDSSFRTYPVRPKSGSETVCGVKEDTRTTLEDKSFANMFVDDGGNLYVPDTKNNRVLKYISPFTTDTIADEVWGQADFTGNLCNRGEAGPSDLSLCYETPYSGYMGVALDSQRNLWVADGGNNRVLRFLFGDKSQRANLVLGQTDFSSNSSGTGNNKFHSPAAVSFDASGNLYVADSYNNRVMKFTPPFATGQTGTTFVTGFQSLMSVQTDPAGRGIWTYDLLSQPSWDAIASLWNFQGGLISNTESTREHGGGSIGIDADGKVLLSLYGYTQNVFRYSQQGETFVKDKSLFSPPDGYNLTTGRRLEHPAWVGVAVLGDQLVVSDGRLLYWNGLDSLTSGKHADGYVGPSTFTQLIDPGFSQIKADSQNRLWAKFRNEVWVYQGPLSQGLEPFKKITSPLTTIDGRTFTFTGIEAPAPSPDGEFLWISEPNRHRVFRIRHPLTDPKVDVLLGQKDIGANLCNRGEIPPPNIDPWRPASEDAKLDMLCYPGAISLDRQDNLFVSDHFLEVEGNWRLLMFTADTFPPNNSEIIYAPFAAKEFPRVTNTNDFPHMTFESAFDSHNQMVVGLNPASGKRFVDYYLHPTDLNPQNHSDPAFAEPNGQLIDFYGWPVAVTFDSRDNLYVYDANRGKVMIYEEPILYVPTPTSTPIPTSTPTPIPFKRVFVTSTFYRGNLGGLSGADGKCQEGADDAGLGGEWKAWLSDASSSASARLTHANVPYVRIDNQTVANNWADLTDGILSNKINVTETGDIRENFVWTNTAPNGERVNESRFSTCVNWTNASSKRWTMTGHSGSKDPRWTKYVNYFCYQGMNLYCFEQ
jgi:hypothetical protein